MYGATDDVTATQDHEWRIDWNRHVGRSTALAGATKINGQIDFVQRC
jgi:hypothetical protein